MKLLLPLFMSLFISFGLLAEPTPTEADDLSGNNAPSEMTEGEIVDPRTLYGGSLGGAGIGEDDIQRQEEESAIIEGQSVQQGDIPIACEDAMRVCQ